MARHPKFIGDRITDQEHDVCMARFGRLTARFIHPVLAGMGLYPRGRWQKTDAPCLYIFRHERLYEQDERSLFLHIQETRIPNAIEVVFRRQRGFTPLDDREWRFLRPCYFEPNNDNWKSFVVENDQDILGARCLIQKAIAAYDEYYE